MNGTKTTMLAGMVVLATSAMADTSIGGGKYMGMAGAGSALPWASNARINPALYAFASKGFGLDPLRFGYRVKGVSFNDLRDNLSGTGNGGLNQGNLTSLAKTFGDETTQFGMDAGLQLKIGPVFIDGNVEALTQAVPNALLQADVAAGATAFNPGSRLDGYGYGFYSIDFGGAIPVPMKADMVNAPKVSVGTRAKLVRGYYSHHFVSGAQITAGTGSTQGVEMGGSDVLNKSGLGLDFGVHAQFGPDEKPAFASLNVENLLKPNVGFDSQLPNAGGMDRVDPFRTRATLGVATKLEDKVWLAADLFDITNATDFRELRIGADFEVAKGIGLRAGYGSRNGIAIGFSILGINVAFQPNRPTVVQTAYRF